jgi:hypothetical protein
VDKDWLKKALEITGGFENAGNPWAGVTGNFDGQGISCGIIQWCLGQGDLQVLMTKRVAPEVVHKYMPTYGDKFLSMCKLSPDDAVEASLEFQTGSRVNDGPLAELKELFASPEMVDAQMAWCEGTGTSAMKLATQWAKDTRGANPTLKEFCWFFDLITENGGMKDVWYQNVKHWIDIHGNLAAAKNAVCKWLSGITKDMYGSSDAHKNASLWNEVTDMHDIELLILGYLRCRKSRDQFQADVCNRRGTLAIARGYVHGDFYKFEELKA